MTNITTPGRILMATDLSARCDRALARAAILARNWNAQLVVGHVVEAAEIAHRDRLTSNVPSWRRPQSWAQCLDRSLRTDLVAEGIDAKSMVIIGSSAEALQQAVIDEAVDLIVLGIAKDARMDRIQLGSTVDTLVRHSRVPVLNVRSRARSAYRHVVVATDFSAPSLHALRLAARWFEGARLVLFHAFLPPGSTLATGVTQSESYRIAMMNQCDLHLADAALPETVTGLQRVIEQGTPEALLADYIASEEVDLVVLGSQGRGGLARALLGSTAENLLHTLDGDTLVVRGA